MKTGFLITARMGSSRLKDKHFLPVNGQPILLVLIKRIHNMFLDQILNGTAQIIITTPDTQSSEAFNGIAPGMASLFRGSPDNIPLRHLQTSDAFCFDSIIAVDGDDPLCSVDGMKKVQNSIFNGEEYVKTNGLPLGMNSMGYTKEFLRRSVMPHANCVVETGWDWIFDKTKLLNIKIDSSPENNNLRFTLDYQEDYVFLKRILELIGDEVLTIKDSDVVEKVISNKIYELNEMVTDEYWKNFNLKKSREAN